MPRFYADAKAHIADIFADSAEPPDEPQLPSEDGLLHFPADAGTVDGAKEAPDAVLWNLLEERRAAPGRPAHRRSRRTSDFYVVGGDKRRIILSALVTPADVMENQRLWLVGFRRKIHPCRSSGDTTYGTVEDIVAFEDAGIRAYVPLPDMNHRRPFYGQDDFIYDATEDQYRCPADHALV